MFKKISLSLALVAGFAYGASKTAKVSDFKFLHSESTITKDTQYKKLLKLDDNELKKSATQPKDGQKVTVKKGTMILYNGNTRIYLLKKRGFDTFVVPYDEAGSSSTLDAYDDY
jgi:hypothetical protein